MILSNPEKEGNNKEDAYLETLYSEFKSNKKIKQFSLEAKIKNKDININFLFSNLRLVITTPILKRLVNFLEKIKRVQAQSEQEELKQKLMLEALDPYATPHDGHSMEDEDMVADEHVHVDTLNKPKQTNPEKGKGYLKALMEERESYLMRGKTMKKKDEIFTSSINAVGTIQDLSIWIPLNSNDEFSRVMCLSLAIQVSFRQASLTKHVINQLTKTVLEVLPEKDIQDATVSVNSFVIYMLNRHLIKIKKELDDEKLLLPSRITLVYDKLVKAQDHTSVTNIDVTVEPLDLKIGFREIDNFKQFSSIFGNLMNDVAKAMNPLAQSTLAQNDKHDKTSPEETMNKTQVHQKDSIPPEKLMKERKPMKDRKHKEFDKMIIKAKTESIIFSLMDDTGKHEYPLVNFDIRSINARVEQESGLDDAATHILKL